MKRVPVTESVTLACEDVGSGPAVLLVHGGCMSHRVWEAQTKALVDAGYRVIAPDLRGHGASDEPTGGYTATQFAADLSALLDELDVESVALVGWSLGATVASTFVRSNPDRVRALVLVSSSIFQRIATAETDEGTDTLPLDRLLDNQRRNRPQGMERFVSGMFGTEPDEWTRRWLWGIGMQTPMRAAVDTLEVYRDPDVDALTDGLTALDLPAAVFHGELDSAATIDDAAVVANDVLQNGRLVAFEESGHVPFLEETERFTQALLDVIAP